MAAPRTFRRLPPAGGGGRGRRVPARAAAGGAGAGRGRHQRGPCPAQPLHVRRAFCAAGRAARSCPSLGARGGRGPDLRAGLGGTGLGGGGRERAADHADPRRPGRLSAAGRQVLQHGQPVCRFRARACAHARRQQRLGRCAGRSRGLAPGRRLGRCRTAVDRHRHHVARAGGRGGRRGGVRQRWRRLPAGLQQHAAATVLDDGAGGHCPRRRTGCAGPGPAPRDPSTTR
ncbi:MAG: hypothetical protein GAK30_02683 [Paracidovorax wautersii]|uniref:Uncharacterized protein n=1 Tax=Paracidovorax wautersii TaxID=1177982 RepID=A0A7V8JPJ8_9BURK|nr:MAG: hypothetical protein GAK30_02683 [Paracidovorax wautersii]